MGGFRGDADYFWLDLEKRCCKLTDERIQMKGGWNYCGCGRTNRRDMFWGPVLRESVLKKVSLSDQLRLAHVALCLTAAENTV